MGHADGFGGPLLAQRYAKASGVCARQASGDEWSLFETPARDLIATAGAKAVVICFDAPQRTVDLVDFCAAPVSRRQRHLLHLHGIDPRQTANAILIELHWRTVGLGKREIRDEIGPKVEQALARCFDVDCHGQRTRSTGTCTVRIIAVVVLPTMSVRSGEWP